MIYVIWYLQVVGRYKDRRDLENFAATIKNYLALDHKLIHTESTWQKKENCSTWEGLGRFEDNDGFLKSLDKKRNS